MYKESDKMNEFINITLDNIDSEHICCAIGDPKHQNGVDNKKAWIKERIKEGHVFRKLNAKGKVFIEYAPLEYAWTPINGNKFLYIYCLQYCHICCEEHSRINRRDDNALLRS